MQYYVDHYGNVLTRKEYAEITGQQKPRETQQQKNKQEEEEKKEGRVCTQ